MQQYKVISRSRLVPPPQPLRATMSSELLEDLHVSIRELGILEPLLVTEAPLAEDGDSSGAGKPSLSPESPSPPRYEIIDGHRRFLAAELAGLHDIPCIVFADAADAKWAMMLHANICREDVTPTEEGFQFLELAEKRGWSMSDLTRFFRRSEAYINERAVLVRDYPDLATAVAERRLGWSVAKVLMRCKDPAHRELLIGECITHGASVRTAMNYVDQWTAQQRMAQGQPAPHTPPAVAHMEPAHERLCLFCQRGHDPQNLVEVPIHWYHRDDMLRLLEQLGVRTPATPS